MTVLAAMSGRDSSVGGENSGEDVEEDGTRAARGAYTERPHHIGRRLHYRSRNRSVLF